MSMDWSAWHDDYDDPSSALSRRLRVVQDLIRRWLADRATDQRHALSLCAGQGRDLLPVLADVRPSPFRVTMVESDAANISAVQQSAPYRSLVEADLSEIEIRCDDAGRSDTYADVPRADLVLACGVFGNVSDGDVLRTVRALPELCHRGATVICTRSRRAPDLTPTLRSWLAQTGFEELAFRAPDDVLFAVGAHLLRVEPKPLVAGRTWFRFVR
jgi:hypothetical protein